MRARPSPGKGRDTHVGLQTRGGLQAAAQEQVCGRRKPAAPRPMPGGQHQKGGWRGRVMGKRQPGLAPGFPVLLAFGAPADGGHVPGILRMFPATPSSVCHPDSRLEASQVKGKAGAGRGIWEGRGGDAPASPHWGRDRSEWRKPCWPPSAGALCGLGKPPFTAPVAPGQTELLHARQGPQGLPLSEALPL